MPSNDYKEALVLYKHPHVIPGTMKLDADAGKMKVQIQTFGLDGKYDGDKRRVATSDLHQTFFTAKTREAVNKLPPKDKTALIKDIQAFLKSKRSGMTPPAKPAKAPRVAAAKKTAKKAAKKTAAPRKPRGSKSLAAAPEGAPAEMLSLA